jgi:Protein of unknown function (DUF4231)
VKRFREYLPALIARFPVPLWRRSTDAEWPGDWAVVTPRKPDDQKRDYPVLAPDLAFWYEKLEARFRRLDHRAQYLQNQFWLQNVVLIIGGLAATTLGAVQAAMGAHVAAVAIGQAVLTGILVGLTVVIRSRRAQQGYFTSRLKAEQIKSEFFLFLARAGDYSASDRQAILLARVEAIEIAEAAG